MLPTKQQECKAKIQKTLKKQSFLFELFFFLKKGKLMEKFARRGSREAFFLGSNPKKFERGSEKHPFHFAIRHCY